MTYQVQVSFDLDRQRTPQRIVDEIHQKNNLLRTIADLSVFEFDLSDFQHAIEILSQVPPDTLPHLKPYIKYAKADLEELSSLTEYFRKFDQSDIKRKSMENIGVGLSSLFMTKSFQIDWRDISHIPKEHFPRGKKIKKADFIGYRGNLRYYYEAKGTTRGIIRSKKDKAKEQLANIIFNAETKMAFITYIPRGSLDFPPTLFIADPSGEENVDLDINMVRMLHYQNVLLYANFSHTYSIYTKLVKEVIKNKGHDSADSISKDSKKIDDLSKQLHSVFSQEFDSMERRKIHQMEFVGKSDSYQTNDDIYTFFRGIEMNIINKAIHFDYSIDPLKDQIILGTGKSSIFSDGTILLITRKSDDKARKLPVLDKSNQNPQTNTPVKNSMWTRHAFHRSSDYSNKQNEKEKVLVYA